MLKLGVIGCGKVTTMFHIKALKEVDDIELIAVADNNQKRMKEVKNKTQAERGYLDYKELLSDPDVEAVAINTPPRFHEKMVINSLKANKHILCEKPLAQSVEGCLHIKETQRAMKNVVLPGHNYGFTPCLETATNLIDRGKIGKIKRVIVNFKNNLKRYRSKTDFRLEKRFGIVEDILPHILSSLYRIVGTINDVKKVRGWSKNYKIIDNLILTTNTEKNIELECFMNWTSLIPSFNILIEGELGSISMELMKFPFRVYIMLTRSKRMMDKEGFKKYLDIIRFKHPSFKKQYQHFNKVINNLETPRFTIKNEIDIIKAIKNTEERLSEIYKSNA